MPNQPSTTNSQIIKFLRQRDYQLVRELGRGACGQTVLLYDEVIQEQFVCKKYVPWVASERERLFDNFVREIKLLHKLHHENVVRFFNYYLYPTQFTGYILMEFVDGQDISDYVAAHPENTNGIFVQAINGFAHLESQSILHRDIRPTNILVDNDGVLKIIDLGFGKRVENSNDFDKSIELNWWCATPADFAESRYDFATEVYFVGKLFEKLITDNAISHFKYLSTLRKMSEHDPANRTRYFGIVQKEIGNEQFAEFEFNDVERRSYRDFADQLCSYLSKFDSDIKYVDDAARILRQLETAYRSFMLESHVPAPVVVVRCFVDGTYYYNRNRSIDVDCVRDFISLFKAATEEKRRVILANLYTRFDTIVRDKKPVADDEIPF